MEHALKLVRVLYKFVNPYSAQQWARYQEIHVMAMKLEVIITHDETNNKCSVEWSVDTTERTTTQEEKTLSMVKKAVLLQLGYPTATPIIH